MATSATSASGYKGVTMAGKSGRCYARLQGEYLGHFTSAVEAAVAVARHFGQAEEKEEVGEVGDSSDEDGDDEDDADDEVVEEAGAVHPVRNVTGYKGVRITGSKFEAVWQSGGKTTYLGSFETAVEAAVAYARRRRGQGRREDDDGNEVVKEAEGLGFTFARSAGLQARSPDSGRSLRSDASGAGQQDNLGTPTRRSRRWWRTLNTSVRRRRRTTRTPSRRSGEGGRGPAAAPELEERHVNVKIAAPGRFQAMTCEDGKWIHLGSFRTAVKAAVAYARHVGEADARNSQVVSGGGLHLHLNCNNATGYMGVTENKRAGKFQARWK